MVKIWKVSCQQSLGSSKLWLTSTYHFMCEVEQQAYDLSKSTLVDAECLKFKPSLIVASLITAAIEINLRIKYHNKEQEAANKPKSTNKKQSKEGPSQDPPVLEQLC